MTLSLSGILQNRSIGAILTVVTLAVVTVTSSVPAQAAALVIHTGSGTDGIAASPATNGNIDKSRTNFDYQLNPGQPAEDSIYISNTGTTSQQVTMYARDAFLSSKGEFSVQDQTQLPSDVGRWVSFVNEKAVYTTTLKPKAFVTIPFRVNTPTGASPGDHVGAIVVSARTTSADISIVRRIAIRLYARLTGQVSPRLAVENLKINRSLNQLNPFDSEQSVSYDLKNAGNVSLSADVVLQAFGPLEISVGNSVTTRLTDLLPGASRHITAHIHTMQTGIVGLSVIYTGILDANAVNGIQQPRGRIDVSEFVFPTGWLTYLLLVLLIISLGLFTRRVLINKKDVH